MTKEEEEAWSSSAPAFMQKCDSFRSLNSGDMLQRSRHAPQEQPITTVDHHHHPEKIIGPPSPLPPSSSSRITGKAVRFSTVQFQEHPMIVGDNPAVSRGVPISIAWESQEEYVLTVDDYERARPPRRSIGELKRDSLDRVRLCKQLGYSRSEIVEANKQIAVIQKQRTRTRETLHLSPVLEVLEKIKKATLNYTIRRSTKQRERELYGRDFLDFEALQIKTRKPHLPHEDADATSLEEYSSRRTSFDTEI